MPAAVLDCACVTGWMGGSASGGAVLALELLKPLVGLSLAQLLTPFLLDVRGAEGLLLSSSISVA